MLHSSEDQDLVGTHRCTCVTMTFSNVVQLVHLWVVVFILYGEASQLRNQGNRNGRSAADSLHLQIASEPPIQSTVEALDCVSAETDRALRRNNGINSRRGDLVDANALILGEARALQEESQLHRKRAQDIEDIKAKQSNRHDATMKEIQEHDQKETKEKDRELELLKEAESSAKRDLEEENHLLREAEKRVPASKSVRLQQEGSKNKSREEVAALMQYPLLGFSLPSAVNPIEYLSKITRGTVKANAHSKNAAPYALPTGEASESAGHQDLEGSYKSSASNASFEEKDKKKHNKTKKAAKQKAHGNEQGKGECKKRDNSAEEVLDEEADAEANENSAAKALHDIENAVRSPFKGGDDSTYFGESFEEAGEAEQSSRAQVEDSDDDETNESTFSSSIQGEDEDDDDVKDDKTTGFTKSGKNIKSRARHEETTNEPEEDGDDSNNKEALSVTKSNKKKGRGKHSKGGKNHSETEGDEPEEESGREGKTKSKNSSQNTGHRSPVEATEEEAKQAKTLQQSPEELQQQSSNNANQRQTIQARARFAASRAAEATSALDGDDDEDDAEISAPSNELEEQEALPERAGAHVVQETQKWQETLPEREKGSAKQALAEEQEERKLLAAEQDAEETKSELKACAQGSFLSCRKHRQERHRH